MKAQNSLLLLIVSAVLFLAIPVKSKSQIAHGFISVASDCYTFGMVYPWVSIIPQDVGDSNNCTPSKGMCADNSGPEGTMEVQSIADENGGDQGID